MSSEFNSGGNASNAAPLLQIDADAPNELAAADRRGAANRDLRCRCLMIPFMMYIQSCQEDEFKLAYVPVFACISVIIWICCAAAYSLPILKALGLILGIFIPCGCIAIALAAKIPVKNLTTFWLRVFAVAAFWASLSACSAPTSGWCPTGRSRTRARSSM
jgi:4-amino-4-deoxy-L-arabinose transferase-like glycosyltransferase